MPEPKTMLDVATPMIDAAFREALGHDALSKYIEEWKILRTCPADIMDVAREMAKAMKSIAGTVKTYNEMTNGGQTGDEKMRAAAWSSCIRIARAALTRARDVGIEVGDA